MAHLYHIYGTKIWYQDKEVRSFPTPKKTDRNLNVFSGQNTNFDSPHTFFNFDWQFRPSCWLWWSLEVSIIAISIATLQSTVLHFPQDMDLLLSTVLVLCVALWIFSVVSHFEKVFI